MQTVLAMLLFLAPPAAAEPLQFSVIAGSATHEAAWRIAQVALQRAGLQGAAREMPAERALVMANSGATDGDVARMAGIEQAYTELVRVPEPIYHYSTYAFSYRKLDVSAGWASLRHYTVCLRRGVKLFEARTAGMKRRVLDDEGSLMRMLRGGGCDVALLEQYAPDVLAQMAAKPPLYRLAPALEVTPLYLYLHRRHAELAPRLGDALKQMRLEGTLQRITSNPP